MSEKTKYRGPAPVVIPSKIAKWIAASGTNAKVNNYKVSGGRPTWNGRK
ncbi:hypothetical protein P4V54_09155 [Brevibacillus nitrificans]|nr:hypothetical protein [Brevibacillus nitrificans]